MKSIKKKLIKNNIPHKINDNISQHLKQTDLSIMEKKCTKLFKSVFKTLLIDLRDENVKDTPKRMAKLYINELLRGRFYNLTNIKSFPLYKQNYNLNNNIFYVNCNVNSLCCHHFLPIKSSVKIGIIFNTNNVLGLSKYYRICNWCFSRAIIQEDIILLLRNKLVEYTKTENIAIFIDSTHDCCSIRGINQKTYSASNLLFSGIFENNEHFKNLFLHKF